MLFNVMDANDHDWHNDPNLTQIADEIYELEEAMMTCALRFKGYEYVERNHPQSELPELTNPVVSERIFHDDDLDNLAVFFALRRFLGKWGGEHCTPWSDAHTAYRLLFLHCYRLAIPSSWILEENDRRWRREFEPRRESIAAAVRRSLKTPGDGPQYT